MPEDNDSSSTQIDGAFASDQKKPCLECGLPMKPGRDDRKFCDAICRTSYNNRIRRERRESASVAAAPNLPSEFEVPIHLRLIMDVLLKNRDILCQLCSGRETCRLKTRDLVGKGFNPKFFTSEADPTTDGHVYRFNFDYGYRQISKDTIIVYRPREIDMLLNG